MIKGFIVNFKVPVSEITHRINGKIWIQITLVAHRQTNK